MKCELTTELLYYFHRKATNEFKLTDMSVSLLNKVHVRTQSTKTVLKYMRDECKEISIYIILKKKRFHYIN